MKGPILVSLKTLCKLYPLYTKSGSIWKNRVDWTKIEIPGMLIVTQFGIFTFVKAERINKIWYWTLQSVDGSLYTIKRDQARKNKKMPKKIMRITKIWKNLINKTKELIDTLIEEANKIAHTKNVETWEDIQEEMNEDIQDGCIITDLELFRNKTRFAYKHLNVKRVYRQLANIYHPDKTSDNREYFEIVNALYNIYNK